MTWRSIAKKLVVALVYVVAVGMWAMALWTPALGHHMREIAAIRDHKPYMTCGTGGLAWFGRTKGNSAVPDALHRELVAKGWTFERKGLSTTYRVTKGAIITVKGYASVRSDYPEKGDTKIYISFSQPKPF